MIQAPRTSPRAATLAAALLVGALAIGTAGAATTGSATTGSAASSSATTAPTRSTASAALAAPAVRPAPAAAPVAAARPARVTTAATGAATATGGTVARLVCEPVRGLRLCSHGDDSHLHEPSSARSTGGSSSSTSSTRIGCYRSGPRVQTVYARPASTADRFSALLPSFQGWAGAVEKSVDDSAHKTGGARHVRFVSTPSGSSCTLSVLRVTLPAEAFVSFPATVSALRDIGLDKAGLKYLVWSDAKGYCGIASTYQDDSPRPDNANNGQYPSYARIDRSCWGRAETHELMHMLGAVQRTAPHATQGMHCHDGSDVMCYDDGTRGSRQLSVCASTHSRLLDCRGDDYFSTAPASGSYLSTHWNTAFSAFLAREWADPEPAAPAPAPSASPAPRPSPSPSASPRGPLSGVTLPGPLPTLSVR